jgi:lipoic acid synthetase
MPPDLLEPEHAAEAVARMGLMDVVVTSVTRDDLPDGGAAHWVATIQAIRSRIPGIRVEVLVPDFGGNEAALQLVLDARPDVFGHNLETVPLLYEKVRPQATYRQSLQVLRHASEAGLIVKTGLMLGLGETEEQVREVMQDAREAGVHIFYAGQYLQPSQAHAPVERYWHPDEFAQLEREGLAMGFDVVVADSLVRSSYHDERQQAFVLEHLASEERSHG